MEQEGWFDWAYKGVDHKYPGNGGLECRDFLSVSQRCWESLLASLFALGVLIVAYKHLKLPPPRPYLYKGKPEPLGKRFLLLMMCLTFGIELGFKLATRQMIWIGNPCHLATMVQIFILAAPPSRIVTAAFRLHMHMLTGAPIAILFPVINTRLLPFETGVYFLQHILMLIIPFYLMKLGDPYIPEKLFDFSWAMTSFGLLFIYHFLPLQYLAYVTQVNLNNMLCPAVSDPFHGKYYRLFAIGHQTILIPTLGKIFVLLASFFKILPRCHEETEEMAVAEVLTLESAGCSEVSCVKPCERCGSCCGIISSEIQCSSVADSHCVAGSKGDCLGARREGSYLSCKKSMASCSSHSSKYSESGVSSCSCGPICVCQSVQTCVDPPPTACCSVQKFPDSPKGSCVSVLKNVEISKPTCCGAEASEKPAGDCFSKTTTAASVQRCVEIPKLTRCCTEANEKPVGDCISTSTRTYSSSVQKGVETPKVCATIPTCETVVRDCQPACAEITAQDCPPVASCWDDAPNQGSENTCTRKRRGSGGPSKKVENCDESMMSVRQIVNGKLVSKVDRCNPESTCAENDCPLSVSDLYCLNGHAKTH